MKIFNNVFRDKCIKCNRKRLVNKKGLCFWCHETKEEEEEDAI
jgi:hypothetical protein